MVEWVRATPRTPCPVCGRTHYCSVSADGGLVFCTKVPSDRPSSDGAGWLHAVGPSVNGHSNGHRTRPAETRYPVRDARGVLRAIHCRQDTATGKRIWWEMPDGTKKLVGLKPAELPLYGSETIADLAENAPVFVCEGEKATDALQRLGVHAVGTVTGAGGLPCDESLALLAGFNVILWPDNDATGKQHMLRLGQRLADLDADNLHAPRVLTWPEAPEKGDAADFVAAGLGLDDLRALYGAAVEIEEAPLDLESEPAPAPGAFATTDLGNAERLVARHGEDVRWCDGMGRWFRWTGFRWDAVGPTILLDLAKDTVRALEEEARGGGLELAKWAKASQSGRAIASMIALTKTVTGSIAITSEVLDADPMLMGVENGVVDLRTGTLREARRSDYVTKACREPFDDLATCPLWEDFLETIFAGDGEVIRYVQRAAGYSLTGKTGERVIFICHGIGSNGKTTFLEVLAHILGTYAMSTPVETLMARKDTGIPNDLARLKSARFVSATETERGAKLAEARIKAVTGGDRVTARFLHQEFFDFVPQCKLWFATNHRPEIASGGKAIWKRVRLLPFEVAIPDEEIDVDIKTKLLAEAPGILAWLVRGCLEWQRIGLKEPDSIRAANAAYQEDEDVLGAFLEDRAVVEPNVWVSAADLYAEFESWREAHGEERLSAKSFSQAMAERKGIKRRRQSGTGSRGFSGVRLYAKNTQEDGLR